MYRTLIVDDELLMRQYLGNHLSDISPDFCVTGIACDGLEAVELLQKQSFDLVLTDIKMPEMDGLNLAKYIFDLELKTKVIIISGYNEFEYARLAIKYGVSDYLLKPLSDEDIYETLSKIKAELTSEAEKEDKRISLNSYEHYSDQEIKGELLLALLHGNTGNLQLLYQVLQGRNITFAQGYYAIMLFCIDELHLMLQEKQVLENTSYSLDLYQQCKAYCNRNNYVLTYDEQGYTLLLLAANSEEDISVLAHSIHEEILHSYWDKQKPKLISTFGYIVKDRMSLRSSYSSAVEALALCLKKVNSPISSNYYVSQSKFINELNTICDALYTDYISKNTSKSLSDLYLYISLFEEEMNIAAILRYGSYFIRYLAKKCNIKTDYILSAFKELMYCIDESIGSSFDKESIHALFLRVLKVLDHDELFILMPETTKTVESAKEYICTHYHEQISLAMVADSLRVNPSYLSDLFHKSVGESYSKFLTRIRMEQALLLLKSNPNEKIYKVAEKTGFVSAKHFNNVFKKYYGFTPTEYISRNML